MSHRSPFRVLFDIGHPAHVHLFKNLARLLLADGAKVLFTSREKEFETALIEKEGFDHVCFGKHYRTLPGKLFGMVRYDLAMLRTGLRFKPDLIVGHGTIYGAHAAPFLRAKCLAIEDTGNMEQVRLWRPFVDAILTPQVLDKDLGPKQVRYNSYHELAYLHPEFFRPDPSILDWLKVASGEPYAIIRFVSWNATHDVGLKGLGREEKIELVRSLSKRMRVFITAERAVSEDLQPFCLKIPPDRFHHALNYASLVVTEGTTTGTEAGILGVPVVFVSTFKDPNLREMEGFGLVRNTETAKDAFEAVEGMLAQDRQVFRGRAEGFVASKENATRFYHQFIRERYMRAATR